MTDLYESQRSMRNMRKLAMQRGVVAVLDVGSSKIACLVLRFDGAGQVNEEAMMGSLVQPRPVRAALSSVKFARWAKQSAPFVPLCKRPRRWRASVWIM
jgi:hypothetical protein